MISEITLTAPKLDIVEKFQPINDLHINRIIDKIPNSKLAQILFKNLPKPTKQKQIVKYLNKPLPKILTTIITHYNLLNEPNPDLRTTLFIGVCKLRNYSYNTTKKYFQLLNRAGIFNNSKLIPNPSHFIGKPHTRIITKELYQIFYNYLLEHLNKHTAPILLAVYTGLRTMEILQFTTHTIVQLINREIKITIHRKNTNIEDGYINYWEPVYNTYLMTFVENLKILFQDEYNSYISKNINTKLFFMKPNTLNANFKLFYYIATGKGAPMGFGIHSCRHMTATLLNESGASLPALRQFLQHKHQETTKRYLLSNYSFAVKEIHKVFNNVSSNTLQLESDL